MLDRPTSVEEEIARDLRIAIARGVHRAGEILPMSEALARDRLVSPRKVDEAYRKLAEEELVILMDGHGYMIVREAQERARAQLIEALKTALGRAVESLFSAGCSRAEVANALHTFVKDIHDE